MKKIKLMNQFFYGLCIICVLAAINAMGFIFPDDVKADSNWTGAFWSAIVSIVCGVSAKIIYNKHKFEINDESPNSLN